MFEQDLINSLNRIHSIYMKVLDHLKGFQKSNQDEKLRKTFKNVQSTYKSIVAKFRILKTEKESERVHIKKLEGILKRFIDNEDLKLNKEQIDDIEKIKSSIIKNKDYFDKTMRESEVFQNLVDQIKETNFIKYKKMKAAGIGAAAGVGAGLAIAIMASLEGVLGAKGVLCVGGAILCGGGLIAVAAGLALVVGALVFAITYYTFCNIEEKNFNSPSEKLKELEELCKELVQSTQDLAVNSASSNVYFENLFEYLNVSVGVNPLKFKEDVVFCDKLCKSNDDLLQSLDLFINLEKDFKNFTF